MMIKPVLLCVALLAAAVAGAPWGAPGCSTKQCFDYRDCSGGFGYCDKCQDGTSCCRSSRGASGCKAKETPMDKSANDEMHSMGAMSALAGVARANRLDELLGIRIGVEVEVKTTAPKREQVLKAAQHQKEQKQTMSDGSPCPQFCCMAMSSTCMACTQCLTRDEYCTKCALEGMNSIGCEDCPEISMPDLFPGILPVMQTGNNDGDASPSPAPSPSSNATDCPPCAPNGGGMTMADGSPCGTCVCVLRDIRMCPGGNTVTRQPPSCTFPECPALTPCQEAAQASVPSTSFVIVTDQFTPVCNPDGSYREKQCHQSECWCVDDAGTEVGSTRGPQSSSFSCSQPTLTACQVAVASSTGLMGAYTPQCEEDGSYSSVQCHGSIGTCWCVDESGTELLGSRRMDHSVPDCSASVAPSPALTACQQAVASSTGLMGAYTPQCEEDGSYSGIQCHGSIGMCWCVDESGTELLGSRRTDHSVPDCSAPVAPRPSAAPVALSACQQAASRGTGMLGAYVPQCEEDGSYSQVQCHGSTGSCWCVDNSGSELEATRRTDRTRPQCDEHDSPSLWTQVYDRFFGGSGDGDDDDAENAATGLSAWMPVAVTCAVAAVASH